MDTLIFNRGTIICNFSLAWRFIQELLREGKKCAGVLVVSRTPALQRKLREELLANRAHRTSVHTSAAVDTVVGVNRPLVSCFADRTYRTGIITRTAVNAFIGNGISQAFHLPFLNDIDVF
jgi:hypothetical protein